MQWSTARPDWETRIKAGRSLLPDGLPIDKTRAGKALRIFRRLRIPDLPGRPTFGDVSPEWILEFVEAIFGSYDPKTQRQLVREFFLCISKKNGKSSIAAGVMLTSLVMHSRHNEEFLILAPSKDVADNSFIPAYEMVKADAELLKRYKPSEFQREIVNRLDGSILSVKSADAEVLGGQKATSVFVDELWLFGKKAQAKNILSEATGSQASRPEGFVIYATTESDDPPAGVFKDKLTFYRKVRDGEIHDPARLPLIYEYPRDMQIGQAWKDRSTWHIPNPSLGRSVDGDWIAGKLAEAENEGPDSVRLFCAKHFNVEIGLGIHTDRWRGAEFWERQKDTSLAALDRRDRLGALLERCEVVCVGIDGGGLDDLFGLAVLGREREEIEVSIRQPDGTVKTQRVKRWLSWSHAWCHSSVLEVRKSIASRLQDFAKGGELTIVNDDLGDIVDIIDIIVSIRDAGLLGKVAVDPAGLGELADRLIALEITIENGLLMGVGQGYRLMNAIKTAERQLVRRVLRHCGSGLMSWCVGNVKIEPLATAIRATKANAGDAKIDPWSALMNAVEAMGTNPEPSGARSIYDDPEAYAQAFGRSAAQEDVNRTDWLPAILQDMRHPDFAEHKARFERWQDAQADD